MKYLKTFEANSNNLEYDIKDIFLAEADEDRFDLTLVSPYGKDYLICGVSLGEESFEDDEHEGFRLGELKEFLLRLKTYLDDKSYSYTPLNIIIHDGMDSEDHIISHWSTRRYINSRSRSTISLTEKDIDEVDKWYNTIDAPGLLKVYISITH